jgi:translation elongation factor EF-1alpha
VDVGLLVVSGELNWSEDQQNTEERNIKDKATVAYCWGIKQLVVAITKLDDTTTAQQKFEATRQVVAKLLCQVGYKADWTIDNKNRTTFGIKRNVVFVPVR